MVLFINLLLVVSGYVLSPELLDAVDTFELLKRTEEEIPILESERNNVVRIWGKRCNVIISAQRV
jgi:hypothetical protein